MKKTLPELTAEAHTRLKGVVFNTPLQRNDRLSKEYDADIYLKREDLQRVRSYKLRGAYNRISLLSDNEKKKGVVCASAGNHAQGVAWSCKKLNVHGTIYMPRSTPKQKIERVQTLGRDLITMELIGDTFDESNEAARTYAEKEEKAFVHPFDDINVMAGQGTVALEVFEKIKDPIDIFVIPIGGGGLVSGTHAAVQARGAQTQIIGAEPAGAASMEAALKAGHVVTLDTIDTFVDGAAVKTVGTNTFEAVKDALDSTVPVDEGRICEEMITLYQTDGIITEPAGALSVAALDSIRNQIRGKTVVCIVSGGNNDMSRYPEIVERSLAYQGLKHYFIIKFPQRPGALREYLDNALGENDDITLFEYVKKSDRTRGPALVGVELSQKSDLDPLLKRMDNIGFSYKLLERDSPLFQFLV